MTVLGPATLVSHTAARPSCLFDTPHATVQGSFLSILVESSGTLSLESADVDSIFVSADHEVLLLDERSKVGQITLQGDHGVLAGSGFDIEIVEKHHRRKKDAPSGTALALADSINEAMDQAYHYTYDRSGRSEAREFSLSAAAQS